LDVVPDFEKMLVRSGIHITKYWFSISDEEQQFRFRMRIHDPLKRFVSRVVKVIPSGW
jgi:polyphosphate kinase 2 (PPK2 family)